MKIETLKVSELRGLETNVRKHSGAQIAEFVKSLKMFGQTRPFVIDEDNTVLVGNGMLEAMRAAGIKECTAYRVTGMSDKEKKKLILTDNKIYSLGADDFDNIEQFIRDISADGDFDIPGFDSDSLKALTATAEEVLDDVMSYGKVETLPAKNTAQEQPKKELQQNFYPEKEEQHKQPEASDPEEAVKTIVCPCCGEVIRI